MKPLAPITIFALAAAFFPIQSLASASGFTGYSGNPNTNSGSTCSLCHNDGIVPNVSLSGPAEVVAGETAYYTLSISGGQSKTAGFDISANGGDLNISIAGTSKSNGELKHTSPFQVGTDSYLEWQFSFTAPNSPGDVTLYAAAVSADGNGQPGGDNAAATSIAIKILKTQQLLPPTALFQAPASAPVGATVDFDPSASSNGDGVIERYLWDFGDGSDLEINDKPSHQFNSAGNYTVTLAVTDSNKYTGVIAHTITIGDVTTPSPGEELYNTHCKSCHGLGGSGGIARAIIGASVTQVQTALATVPNMQGISVSDSDIQLIVDYLANSGGTPPPRPSDGPGLYGLLCAGCHGADGSGGIAKGITGAPFIMISQALTNISAMQSIIINDSEIQKVAEFLLAGGNVTIPSDGAGLYQVFCSVCHGDGGHGGKFKAVTGAAQAMIDAALRQQTWMQDLNLSSSQVSAIAAFLGNGGSAPLPSDGAGLYGVFCAVCHGADGRGEKYKVVTGASLQFIQSALNNVSLMRGLNTNSSQQSSIATFLAAGGGGDKPGTGASLYHVYCETCHGVNGYGGRYESVRGASSSSISSEINSNSNMRQLDPYLNSSEISLISSFLRGGQ